MSLKSDLFDALGPLVSNGSVHRCYPDVFPQPPAVPVWPAIRYSVISGEVFPDICGSGADQTDDVLVQIDAVAPTGTARDALRLSIRNAMSTFQPPATLQGVPREEYDAETKTYRASMDYVIYGSST